MIVSYFFYHMYIQTPSSHALLPVPAAHPRPLFGADVARLAHRNDGCPSPLCLHVEEQPREAVACLPDNGQDVLREELVTIMRELGPLLHELRMLQELRMLREGPDKAAFERAHSRTDP